MGALRTAITAAALLVATPVHADPIDRWRPLIVEASTRFGVLAAWIERVIRAESRGFTILRGRPITSRAGAMGLMQLMPDTWNAMRVRLALGSNPQDPHDNIMAGTYYLRLMYDRFGYPGLFGAYNAGPGRYADYVARGRILPEETRTYLASLTGASPSSPAPPNAPAEGLFFVRHTESVPVDAQPTPGMFFVSLTTARERAAQ